MSKIALSKSLIAGSILLLFGFVKAQNSTYTIHLSGNEIGEINASLTLLDDQEVYEVVSNVNFKVLWRKYNRTTNSFVIYENKALKTSYSSVRMNDELQDSATMELIYDKYKYYKHPDESYTSEFTNFDFASVMLYFQEPIGIDKIWSERYLEYCVLEPHGKDRYKLYLPTGKVNYYTYEDGILTEVLVDRTWFNLKFQKKQNTPLGQ